MLDFAECLFLFKLRSKILKINSAFLITKQFFFFPLYQNELFLQADFSLSANYTLIFLSHQQHVTFPNKPHPIGVKFSRPIGAIELDKGLTTHLQFTPSAMQFI